MALKGESRMLDLSRDEIIEKVNSYRWYHEIKVTDDIYTPSSTWRFSRIWKFIQESLAEIDFKDKKVLDVGCRDGLFSFKAEEQGAKEIIGIDNNLSAGSTEFLIPFFESKVKMYEMNLYDLTPETFGKFDIILFPGVLYHLRFPFWGLKKLTDCLHDKGLLFIESGMNVDRNRKIRNHEFLYCGQRSPHNRSGCTYFNKVALENVLECFDCKLLDYDTLPPKLGRGWITNRIIEPLIGKPRVLRQRFIFQKDVNLNAVKQEVKDVWFSTHHRYDPDNK